jgi:hypothetical protein
MYRFLEKGFAVAKTINVWTKYDLLFCHADDFETTLQCGDVMDNILKDQHNCDHINKHFQQDLVFQSDEVIIQTLKDCYKHSSSVSKDLQHIIDSEWFKSDFISVYIQSQPKHVELTDCIRVILKKDCEYNKKWLIVDQDGNDILFLLKNVVISRNPFGQNKKIAKLDNHLGMQTMIEAFEQLVYKSTPTDLQFRSVIFQNLISFKMIHQITKIYGREIEGGKANVLLRPYFIRKFSNDYTEPFVYIIYDARMIRWLN